MVKLQEVEDSWKKWLFIRCWLV